MAKKVICRAPLPRIDQHECPNIKCLCSDFRFPVAIEKLERVLGIYGNVDGIQIPGGIKAINDESGEGMVTGWFQLLRELHGVKNFLLIAHAARCGAYTETGVVFTSDDEEELFHEEQLKRARDLIGLIISKAKVRMFYVRRVKNRKQAEVIEFI